jgi:hypothetical protein
LAIEFDTYDNGIRTGDIKEDHTAFFDTDTAGLPLSTAVSLGNVEDGKWHSVQVNWDVDTQTLNYTLDSDSTKSGSLSRNLADEFFGGSDSVYFGWTAATGRISNQHLVKVTAIDAVYDSAQAGLNSTTTIHDQL